MKNRPWAPWGAEVAPGVGTPIKKYPKNDKKLEQIIFNFVLFEINGMILDNHHFKHLQLNFNNNSKNYDPFEWVDKCRRFNVPSVSLNAKYKFIISKGN